MTEKSTIGLAGEYYVLAQLAHRGFVGALTLSNTKAVDILVSQTGLRSLCRLEVKTTQKPPGRERLFGPKPFFRWPMSVKHQSIRAANLFYCFVWIESPERRPRFFIVPSAHVAKYVRDQHRKYEKARGRKVRTLMRMFRIAEHDPERFEDDWNVLVRHE